MSGEGMIAETRSMHGEHSTSTRITAERPSNGPVVVSFVGPKITIAGVPPAGARWARPMSFEINGSETESTAAASARFVLPVMSISCSWADDRTSAETIRSSGAPTRITFTLRSRSRRSASSAYFETPHRFAREFLEPAARATIGRERSTPLSLKTVLAATLRFSETGSSVSYSASAGCDRPKAFSTASIRFK